MQLKEAEKMELLETVKSISNLADIYYIRQKEPKGLGHAIGCAKAFIGDEPFAILLGDDIVYSPEKPCLKQLIECFDEYQASVLGVQSIDRNNVDKYGIVDGINIDSKVCKVKGLIEKPSIEDAPSNTAILGRYIVTPKIFKILENTKPGKGNEIQLTDALIELSKQEAIYAYNFDGKRYDVGDKLGFLQATVEFALREPNLRDEFVEYLKNTITKL